MAKDLNRFKGGVGEGMAADFLKGMGYQVLEMNTRTKYGEIDLICIDEKTLVFVEVKLKVGEDFGTPEEMIDRRKILQVKRTAEFYLLLNPEVASNYTQYRIDAVCIVIGREGEIQRQDHYENIEL